MMNFKPYHLFLTIDNRYDTTYHKFVGIVGDKRDYYIKKVVLGDRFADTYRKERVGLKVVKRKERILIVEVSDASL